MPQEYRIAVAGQVISLNIDKKFEAAFLKDYALFLTDAIAQVHLEIELSPDLPPIKEEDVRLSLSGQGVNIIESYFSGSLDLTSGRGQLKINPVSFLPGLGQFLRNLYSLLVVLEDKGIILHAAAILRKEEAYIFIGPSGAGKSTVAKLSEDSAAVLGDDLVMIKKTAATSVSSRFTDDSSQKKIASPGPICFSKRSGLAMTRENGTFMVFPTPNWGDRHSGEYHNRPYRIRSIFKLIKDNRVYLERFSPAVALAQVFTKPQVPLERVLGDRLLEGFRELVSAVPFYGLHFLPEVSFWNVVLDAEKYIEEARKLVSS